MDFFDPYQLEKEKENKEKLFLIETYPKTESFRLERSFAVTGLLGALFNVTITNEPFCDCLEYKFNHSRCRHIKFILSKLMKCDDPDNVYFDDDELQILFSNIPEFTDCLKRGNSMISRYHNGSKFTGNEMFVSKFKNKKIIDVSKFVPHKTSVKAICPICLESLNNSDEKDYCKIGCGKEIHSDCFKLWVDKYKAVCPYCKKSWYFTQTFEDIFKARTKFQNNFRRSDVNNNSGNYFGKGGKFDRNLFVDVNVNELNSGCTQRVSLSAGKTKKKRKKSKNKHRSSRNSSKSHSSSNSLNIIVEENLNEGDVEMMEA